jgi:hypothetical protein
MLKSVVLGAGGSTCHFRQKQVSSNPNKDKGMKGNKQTGTVLCSSLVNFELKNYSPVKNIVLRLIERLSRDGLSLGPSV